jgi:hypothetical protein
MRLLPTTRRGTWALAFAVWLAGCAAVWFVLPVRPIVVLPPGNAGYPILFSGDGRMILTREFGTEKVCPLLEQLRLGPDHYPNGPFRLWDATTGRALLTWAPPSPEASVLKLAPDGSSALVSRIAELDRTGLIDLTTGRREDLPWTIYGRADFSADGRYLVADAVSDNGYETLWWDLRARRVVGTVRDAELMALATDGKWASISVRQEEGRPVTVTVREPVTGRELSRYRRDKPFWELSFSRDGAYLLAADGESFEAVDVADGRVCLRLPQPRWVFDLSKAHLPQPYSVSVLSNAHQVATIETEECDFPNWDQAYLVWRDLPSGQIVRRTALRTAIPPGWMCVGVKPLPEGGRWLVYCSSDRSDTFVGKWLSWIPFLEWLADTDISYWTLILDTRTGEEAARIPGIGSFLMAPDGQTLLAEGEGGSPEFWNGSLEFWNVPPRKPRTWLAVAAALWALPVAWLARRRMRRPASGAA